jgi:hypothetical protein
VVAGGLTVFAVTSQNSPASHAAGRPAAPPPLRVVSVTPADGSSGVNGARSVTVTYNQPIGASVPFPSLSPSVPGTWTRAADSATFTPDTGFPPGTHVRVTVKEAAAQTSAQTSAGTSAQTSAKRTTTSEPRGSASSTDAAQAFEFSTAQYSTLRLQQVLAQLGYLPLSWTAYPGGEVTPGSMAEQTAAAYSPPAGSFSWQSGYPRQLRGMWQQGSANTVDTGAIAGFEAAHGMAVNGTASPAVWTALLKAAAAGKRNGSGYSYAVASESSPESLTIWHNGRQVFYSPANTGISVAPTALGTYFVYEKLPYQIMQGTNPDGSSYADPVQWVSYFNGGDAVHYFPRGSFGWPQSLGCVELPYSAAERSYGYLPYGTLVSVDP